MRRTFHEHGRAYWSSQFPLILEKHGWLDFSTAEPEILESVEGLDGHALVIVAWLPEELWRAEYVETLRAYKGELFLEGPFPPSVERFLGAARAAPPVDGLQGSLQFSDEAASYIRARFGSPFPIGHRSGPDPSVLLAPDGDPNPLELAPRESVTRPASLSRDIFGDLAVEPLRENAASAGVSLVLAYAARFRQNDQFFDDPLDNALAFLACVRCLMNVSSRGPLGAALHRLVLSAGGSNRRAPFRADERGSRARAVWGVGLAEAAKALDDSTFAERAKDMLADIQPEWLTRTTLDPVLSRWRFLLALDLTGSPKHEAASAALEASLPVGGRPTATSCWLDATLASRMDGEIPSPIRAGMQRIEAVAASLEASGDARLGAELEGLNVPDLMLTLASLQLCNHESAARRLWRVLVEDLYDTHDDLFFNARVVDGELEPARGRSINPIVALGLLDAAGQTEIVHPPTEALDAYTLEQRNAWVAAPYTFQPYRIAVPDDTVASLDTRAGAFPAIWRRSNVTATSFQLLAHLVHLHTVEPLAAPFSVFRSGDTIALEYLLVHLLGSSLGDGAPRVVTTATWPWGTSYVVTVRHDVDRILDDKQFKRILDFERKHGLAVSWFWIPGRLNQEHVTALEHEPNHEIGLHSVRLDRKPQELEHVSRAFSGRILGEAVHGSGDGWLGHLSVRAAVEAGLLYAELAPPVADTPYARYPVLESDGRVGAERIVGVTYNISIESKLGDEPGSEGGPGLYRQLLNHPDLNFDRLRGWVEALPGEAHLSWTCEEVARWWRATHSEGGLSVRHLSGEDTVLRFEVEATEPVEDLELRLPCRPEGVAEVSVDEDAAEWSAFDEPEYGGIRIRLSLSARASRTIAVRYAEGAPE